MVSILGHACQPRTLSSSAVGGGSGFRLLIRILLTAETNKMTHNLATVITGLEDGLDQWNGLEDGLDQWNGLCNRLWNFLLIYI